MMLSINFTGLLASLLLIASSAEAAPIPANAGIVTLPLRAIRQNRDNLHPYVYYQQHANQAHRRLARMTGTTAPSDEELALRLHKRYQATGQTAEALKAYRKAAKAAKGKAPAKTGNLAAAAAGAGTGAGVSQVDLDAAVNGGLTAADAPAAFDSLGLDIEANDVGYIATVQIGTPPRDFKILMDSGSADFWVAAEGCQKDVGGACSAQHTELGATSSSSFVDTKKPFSVTYGAGQVSGNIITDDVAFAGLALAKQTFGTASVESKEFNGDDTSFDGLMGLAQSILSNQKTLTPPESLAKSGAIKNAIVSYKISRLSDLKNDGEVSFGGLDPTKFDAKTLVTLPNASKVGFWEGAMDAVTVDGKDLALAGRTAILDTGTTLIIAPDADATAVHAAIPGSKTDGQGSFTVPCTTTASVALTFGGQVFDIQPQDIAFLPVDPADPTGDCISGISSGNIGGPQEWLVGDVFLKNAYFSHDVGKNTVSLAKLV